MQDLEAELLGYHRHEPIGVRLVEHALPGAKHSKGPSQGDEKIYAAVLASARRRAHTAAAKVCNIAALSSQPMQASVMLWP